MRKSRRQFVTRVIEKVGISLILLDIALYFAVLRPVQGWVGAEEQRFAELRRRISDENGRIRRLEEYKENLPGAGDKLTAFEKDHLPPRRHAFSRAQRLLQKVSQASSVQLGPIKYRLDKDTKAPLLSLGFETDVEGTYSGLMKFAHALETADDFIIIRKFTFEPGEGGTMGLRLDADLYVTP